MSMLVLRTSSSCLARQAPALAAAAVVPAAVRWPAQHVRNSSHLLCRATDEEVSTAQAAPDSGDPVTQQQPCSSSVATSTFPYGVMAALASAGAAETVYLTLNKLLNASVACPTGGCDAVLNSPYAQLFGMPLPLLGAGAYTAVAAAAAVAARKAGSGKHVPGWLSTGLASGVCVLAATSAFLMYILASQLGGARCVWCWASAGISAALLASLIAGMDKRQMVDAAAPGLGATAATVAALYIGFGPLFGSGVSSAAELELPYVQPAVTTESSTETISLAKRLKDAGAVMYGAFWCRWASLTACAQRQVAQCALCV